MAKKILVVDDEPPILALLQSRLKTSGYNVISASNGNEALQKVNSERPDLLVMDVMMPPPNGFQVCRMLKDNPDFKKIPIILLTAKAAESDQFWGLESGADAYVTKPYSPKELLDQIQSLLEK